MATVIVRGGIETPEQEVVIGSHWLIADEPVGQGVRNAGFAL